MSRTAARNHAVHAIDVVVSVAGKGFAEFGSQAFVAVYPGIEAHRGASLVESGLPPVAGDEGPDR